MTASALTPDFPMRRTTNLNSRHLPTSVAHSPFHIQERHGLSEFLSKNSKPPVAFIIGLSRTQTTSSLHHQSTGSAESAQAARMAGTYLLIAPVTDN